MFKHAGPGGLSSSGAGCRSGLWEDAVACVLMRAFNMWLGVSSLAVIRALVFRTRFPSFYAAVVHALELAIAPQRHSSVPLCADIAQVYSELGLGELSENQKKSGIAKVLLVTSTLGRGGLPCRFL